MTAADTPSREELLALADEVKRECSFFIGSNERGDLFARIEKALRLAAKPADDGVREATIEECAKILDDCAQDWNRIRDPGMANNARAYARKIRALSTKDKSHD